MGQLNWLWLLGFSVGLFPLLSTEVVQAKTTAAIQQLAITSKDGGVWDFSNDPIRLATDGQGVNITFLATDQVIEKVWFDNPTFATIDFDGCLPGTGGCTSSTARVLHLRRIDTLNLEGLPAANQSQLTVITRDRQNHRQMYLFRVIKSATPGKRVIEIVSQQPAPIAQNSKGKVASSISQDSLYLAIALERGLRQAESQGILDSRQPLKRRLIRLISLLRLGTPVQPAANQAEVSISLIQKLAEQGKYQNVPKILSNQEAI